MQLQYGETKRSTRGFTSVICRTARRKSPCIRKVLLPVVSAYVMLVFFYVPANDGISGQHVAGPPDVNHFVACRSFASASECRSNLRVATRFVSRVHGQNQDMTAIKSFWNVATLRHLGTALRNLNCMHQGTTVQHTLYITGHEGRRRA
jgi:hypothetical protein